MSPCWQSRNVPSCLGLRGVRVTLPIPAKRRRALLGHVLISQDAGWYHVGEPGGGKFRGYTYLYGDFLARLEPAQVPVLMWDNPRAAFGA